MRDDDFFWVGVDEGRLLLQQCADCGALRQPLGPMCPRCQSLRWQARQACGQGRVHSWIVSKHPSQPDEQPRIVTLIDLEEGVRLVSNLQGIAASDVRENLPVELFFDIVDGVRLPQFRPAGEDLQ